jgi:hypothetical protein
LTDFQTQTVYDLKVQGRTAREEDSHDDPVGQLDILVRHGEEDGQEVLHLVHSRPHEGDRFAHNVAQC